jgi:hypothetical protein
LLAENLICKVGAGLEGQLFGEDEGVVAVKEDIGDLRVVSALVRVDDLSGTEGYKPWAL